MVKKVLLCDDEIHILRAAEHKLSRAGYQVQIARDGQEAWEMIQQELPDVLVTDVQMPRMDGFQLSEQVRGNSATKDLPILMLTARGAVGDRVAGLDAGADDYLVKPFALEELLARLRALLRRAVGGDSLSFADVTLDPGTREVKRGDRDVALTKIFKVFSDPDLPFGGKPDPGAIMPPSPGFRVTLYVSPDDKALAAASWLFGSIVRLGRIDATILSADQIEAIALLQAVDIIQVSGTNDFFGHSYFISNPHASADIIALLRYGLRPNEPGRPLEHIAGPFWRVPAQ